MLHAHDFFGAACERYRIKLARDAGKSKPWTTDEAFLNYRFCNVFREDDTTTQWIRDVVTIPKFGKATVGGIIIARWFNRIETLEKLTAPPYDDCSWEENLLYSWSDPIVWAGEGWSDNTRKRLDNVKPLVTGAYIIKTPNGKNKLKGLIWCMEQVLPDAVELQKEFSEPGYTLEKACRVLETYPYLGPFMAYEIVTDLNYSVLKNAPDKMTWANPGPGCARGLGRVTVGNPDHFNRSSKADCTEMLNLMQQLLFLSGDRELWPGDWPEWDMRTVEHFLCEWDKHQRIHLGEGTPKQRYQGAN